MGKMNQFQTTAKHNKIQSVPLRWTAQSPGSTGVILGHCPAEGFYALCVGRWLSAIVSLHTGSWFPQISKKYAIASDYNKDIFSQNVLKIDKFFCFVCD